MTHAARLRQTAQESRATTAAASPELTAWLADAYRALSREAHQGRQTATLDLPPALPQHHQLIRDTLAADGFTFIDVTQTQVRVNW